MELLAADRDAAALTTLETDLAGWLKAKVTYDAAMAGAMLTTGLLLTNSNFTTG